MAVTAVSSTYQWAETTRIARGFGRLAPKSFHATVKRLVSMEFIGLPWPRTAAGMGPVDRVIGSARATRELAAAVGQCPESPGKAEVVFLPTSLFSPRV